ncbi:MAG TPA: hypothetical protein VMJ92_00245 [Candidatus Limnocylindrales bacterium]|nr:hypothetical protein [Candidatus Limnocylindrales bacterium]
MARMVRKQVYIEPRQERLLKRRAKELGLTEAELIRQGIDRLETASPATISREQALREYRAAVRQRMRMRVPQTGRSWTREDLYEERLSRQVR